MYTRTLSRTSCRGVHASYPSAGRGYTDSASAAVRERKPVAVRRPVVRDASARSRADYVYLFPLFTTLGGSRTTTTNILGTSNAISITVKALAPIYVHLLPQFYFRHGTPEEYIGTGDCYQVEVFQSLKLMLVIVMAGARLFLATD